MALTPGQQNAMGVLQQRKQSGIAGSTDLRRLSALRQAQTSGQPARPGNILAGQTRPQKQNQGFGMRGNLGMNPVSREANQLTSSIFDLFAGGTGGLQDSQRKIDFSALPAAPGSQDLAGERQRIEDQLFSSYTRDFGAERDREKAALDQSLAERGINPGSGELYSRTMDDFSKRWDRRFDEARQNAVAAGGSEFERSYGIGRTGRADALAEQVTDRQMPLTQAGGLLELGRLLSGIGFGGANLAAQQRENRLNRRQQRNLAAMNRGGGGGGDNLAPPPPPFNF